jgi:hypothetical protein
MLERIGLISGTEKEREVWALSSRWSPFYSTYLRCLLEQEFQGALIIHGMEEHEVPQATAYLRSALEFALRFPEPLDPTGI